MVFLNTFSRSQQRAGKAATMRLDGGEGRYFNRTEGTWGGHLHIKVARRQFYAGGDVKFPAHNVPAIVDYDYMDSKYLCLLGTLGRKNSQMGPIVGDRSG